jgi:hypothetical protein
MSTLFDALPYKGKLAAPSAGSSDAQIVEGLELCTSIFMACLMGKISGAMQGKSREIGKYSASPFPSKPSLLAILHSSQLVSNIDKGDNL